jgi:3-keto-disaccharide hydrolase
MRLSRRTLVGGAAALGAGLAARPTRLRAAPDQRFDLTKPLEGWQIVTGKWAIEAMDDAAQGHALVQRATDNTFNVIVAPGGPYGDVEVSVRFKPMAGREDASGGIVFRFAENHYYVIRANALEDNFNFYYYEGSRHQIAGASTKAPALGQWHRLRISAEGDRIRGWLNEQQLIDRRDQRYKSGRIGLWTKADSITAFDELTVMAFGKN